MYKTKLNNFEHTGTYNYLCEIIAASGLLGDRIYKI